MVNSAQSAGLPPPIQPSNLKATVATSLTSAEVSALWRGKDIHQASPGIPSQIAQNAVTTRAEVPPALVGKKIIEIRTGDNQILLVRVKDAAKILNMSKADLIHTAQQRPQELTQRMQAGMPLAQRTEEQIFHTLGGQIPGDWLYNTAQIETTANIYQRVVAAQQKTPTATLQEIMSSHEFNDVKDRILQGPHGEFYVILSEHLAGKTDKAEVALGEGSWSKYVGAVNLQTLESAALGIVKTVSPRGQEKSINEHITEIDGEIALKHALEDAVPKGNSSPFLLPFARVDHINAKGERYSGRLAEAAAGATNTYPIIMKGEEPTDEQMATARRYAKDMFIGLAALDKLGIVHRDIKPANVMIVNTPNGDVGKIADWGFACSIKDEMQSEKTSSLGTVQYMSPRVMRGGKLMTEGLNIKQKGESLIEEGDALIKNGKIEEGKIKKLEGMELVDRGASMFREGKAMTLDPRNDTWAMGMTVYYMLTWELPPFLKDIEEPLYQKYGERIENGDMEARQAYDSEFVEAVLALTPDKIMAGYPNAEPGSIMEIAGQCFRDPPPTAEQLAALCKANMEAEGPLW